jgi:hypothetical protein
LYFFARGGGFILALRGRQSLLIAFPVGDWERERVRDFIYSKSGLTPSDSEALRRNRSWAINLSVFCFSCANLSESGCPGLKDFQDCYLDIFCYNIKLSC